MLQISSKPYASDCLEEAMSLAQIKALNSFTFSDCLNYLNYAWSDIYSRLACIDDGYYAITTRITQRDTILPPYVKNSVLVYRSQEAHGSGMQIFRRSGYDDINGRDTYHIDGFHLYCPAAENATIWLRYVPACPQIFFTHRNRDPILHDSYDDVHNKMYGLYFIQGENDYTLATSYDPNETYYEYSTVEAKWKDMSGHVTNKNYNKYYIKTPDNLKRTIEITEDISEVTKWKLVSRADGVAYTDITRQINAQGNNWKLVFVTCDFPYIFVTYQHKVTGEYLTGFLDRDMFFNRWNGFDFTGQGTNCLLVAAKHNDKTGLSVVVKDFNDLDEENNPRIKELGWTPDTALDYPCPEVYRYLVARLADKFSAMNESNVMGVQKELVESKYAFEAYLDKDKSSWKRINNVNPANVSDYL